MKTYSKFLLSILFVAFSSVSFAQNNNAAKALVAEGVTLNDAGKYDDAIAKYNEVIKTYPDYSRAYYEISVYLI